MEFTHTGQKSFTGFLIRGDLQRSVGLGQRTECINELGQVLHALWFNSDGDHRVGVVADGFKGREVLVSRKGDTSGCGSNPGHGSNVACDDLGNGDSVSTDHHGDLLHALWFCTADGVHGFSLVDSARVDATDSDFASVGVHPDLRYHHGKFCIWVARNHGFTNL